MTETLTIRLPAALARELKAKAKRANTNPSEILRHAASEYVRNAKPGNNPMQNHILARAGTWDGDISGKELLRRMRP
jgi:metal-responsive CopG/Arc/MetJ family transcriptional regulator